MWFISFKKYPRIYLKNSFFSRISDNILKKTDTTPLETAREWEMEMEQEELQHLADVSIVESIIEMPFFCLLFLTLAHPAFKSRIPVFVKDALLDSTIIQF